MRISKFIIVIFCLIVLATVVTSCEKVNIEFGESVLADDPDIVFFDSYKVDIATFKTDSFSTSSHEVMSLGYHNDPVFGVVKAGTYAQINLPATNPIANQTLAVTLDSLELIIKPSGEFYGDSAKSLHINVYRLTQNITDPVNNTDVYYNTQSFTYAGTPIGQQTVNLYGKSGTEVHIKLSNALGQELLTKFKDNHEDISSSERFINYFKGIFINTDSTITNSLAFFSAPSDSVIIRLNYHDNGLFPVKKNIDFSFTKDKQFNNISFRHTHLDFSAFVDRKASLISSAQSGNKAFLNTNTRMYIKMNFPTILNLKELHPYIKVVKAELVIKPDVSSYSYPYQLPKVLNLFTTNETNYPVLPFYYDASTLELLSGSLNVDYLYGANTNYSYNITGYINTILEEGKFSTSSLLLYPNIDNLQTGVQRLILNDQTSNRSVQLKLYVLGL